MYVTDTYIVVLCYVAVIGMYFKIAVSEWNSGKMFVCCSYLTSANHIHNKSYFTEIPILQNITP